MCTNNEQCYEDLIKLFANKTTAYLQMLVEEEGAQLCFSATLLKLKTEHFYMCISIEIQIWKWCPLPPPLQKVKFFIYGAIFLNYNISICLPMINNIEIQNWGSPYFPLSNIKFFIYSVILLKFETQHFHRLTNNDCDKA